MASDPLFPPLVRKAIIDSILKDSAATEVTKKLFCKPLLHMGSKSAHGDRSHGQCADHGGKTAAHAWGIGVTNAASHAAQRPWPRRTC